MAIRSLAGKLGSRARKGSRAETRPAADEPPSGAREYDGWVGLSQGRVISGWIARSGTPDERFTIRISLGGYLSGPIEARETRSRLAGRGFGDGACGFTHVLPRSVAATVDDLIEIRIDGQPAAVLTAALAQYADDLAERLRPAHDLEGAVGLHAGRSVSGWIRDPDAPAERQRIRISLGDYLSDPITADEPRFRLAERGLGDGAYGFSLILPDDVAATARDRIEVRLEEGRSPVLTAPLQQYAGDLDERLRPDRGREGAVGLHPGRSISGWIRDPGAPGERQRIRVALGDYLSGPIIADEPRSRLAERGLGDGTYGFSLTLPDDVAATAQDCIEVRLEGDRFPALTAPLQQYADDLDERLRPDRGFDGAVGLYGGRRISGWILRPAALGERQRIRVTLGDYLSDPITANEPRARLAERGLGDGAYGFSVTLPDDVAVTVRDRIEIRLEGERFPVLSTTLEQYADDLDERLQPERGFDGWVGLFAGRRISGWLVKTTSLMEQHTLHIRIGAYVSPPIVADEPRSRLAERGLGDGAYGFSFTLPPDVVVRENDRIAVALPGERIPVLSTAVPDNLEDLLRLQAQRSKPHRQSQHDRVLLWCPITVSGLTTQLEQVTRILRRNRIDYDISYHVRPMIEHPECEHWIEPRDIDSPRMVFYFERFHQFDRGFEGAYKVFYVNLDWLTPHAMSVARVHADVVLCPVTYRLDEMRETFSNQRVLSMPWPPAFRVTGEGAPGAREQGAPIRVLYIGNDYDERSRKSPFEVIEAIERCRRDDLVFDLKFRSALPADIRARLAENPRVGKVIDRPTEQEVVRGLYRNADINLTPNQCEGNGLSILEALASGVVPAILDGEPMRSVVGDEAAYFIGCERIGERELAPLYQTSAENILAFLDTLTHDGLAARKETGRALLAGLRERENELEAVLMQAVKTAGIRSRAERRFLELAHDPSVQASAPAGHGSGIGDLLFRPAPREPLPRPASRIDVVLTTSRRPELLARSLDRLVAAMRASRFEHRLFVAVDGLELETQEVLSRFNGHIDQMLMTRNRLGLPYVWNSMNDLLENTSARSSVRPDFVCYIQDDCLIQDPDIYFEALVSAAEQTDPGYLGFVSGFHTELHPGFAEAELDGRRVIISDSVDGKNFMARPRLLASIGRLTWWFDDGLPRGNPGPVRGSHFDLWQWKESPNAVRKQHRVNLILPGLCVHLADSPDQSTWNNDTTATRVEQRLAAGKAYARR